MRATRLQRHVKRRTTRITAALLRIAERRDLRVRPAYRGRSAASDDLATFSPTPRPRMDWAMSVPRPAGRGGGDTHELQVNFHKKTPARS